MLFLLKETSEAADYPSEAYLSIETLELKH